jgi:leucyl-tRNA synthetase
MFDWRREMISSDEKYYRWTQWFFISSTNTVWLITNYHRWIGCPNCNTTLAREQVWEMTVIVNVAALL